MTIPKCPDKLPDEILQKIVAIGKLWRQSDINPKFSIEVVNKWNKLIIDWKEDKELPLIIRKSKDVRGKEITHEGGRKIIISDNSIAQWVCYNVLNGIHFTKNEIFELLQNDKIPIAFAIKAKEKAQIKYKCTLGKYSINKFGWKLCHIQEVGFRSPKSIDEIDIDTLKEKFNLLMNTNNIFLVPKAIGGIGEIEEFIQEQI